MGNILLLAYSILLAIIYFCIAEYRIEPESSRERALQRISKYTKVSSYQRRNGTIVPEHYRRKPDRRKHRPVK